MQIVPPVMGLDDNAFWEGVADGALRAQECGSCGHVRFPMIPMCPACGSLEWATRDLSGRGTLFSWIVAGEPSDASSTARVIACIALEEGFTMISNLVDVDEDRLQPDVPVQVCFETHGDVVLPQFHLDESGARR